MKKIAFSNNGRYPIIFDTETYDASQLESASGIDYVYVIDEECDVKFNGKTIHVDGKCILFKMYGSNNIEQTVIPVYNEDLYNFFVAYNSDRIRSKSLGRDSSDACCPG